MNWINLIDKNTLEKIKTDSVLKTAVLFKHSTRCSISRMALKNFEIDSTILNNEKFDFYYLDLLAHRDISNAIADVFDVMHQSPQLLLIKNTTKLLCRLYNLSLGYHAMQSNTICNVFIILFYNKPQVY